MIKWHLVCFPILHTHYLSLIPEHSMVIKVAVAPAPCSPPHSLCFLALWGSLFWTSPHMGSHTIWAWGLLTFSLWDLEGECSETRFCQVVQAGPELKIPLPQPPRYQQNRYGHHIPLREKALLCFCCTGLRKSHPGRPGNSTKGFTWGLGKLLASMVETLGLPGRAPRSSRLVWAMVRT